MGFLLQVQIFICFSYKMNCWYKCEFLLIQKQAGQRLFQKKKGLLFRRCLLMNARTPGKDREKQTVKLKITTYMEISRSPVLPQLLWPWYSNWMTMRIVTDQNQSSVEYLKTLLFQERNSNLQATLPFSSVGKNAKPAIFQRHKKSSNLRTNSPKRQNSQSQAGAAWHQNGHCYIT